MTIAALSLALILGPRGAETSPAVAPRGEAVELSFRIDPPGANP